MDEPCGKDCIWADESKVEGKEKRFYVYCCLYDKEMVIGTPCIHKEPEKPE